MPIHLVLLVEGVLVLTALVVLGRTRGRVRASAGELVMTYGWDFRTWACVHALVQTALFGAEVAGPAGPGPAGRTMGVLTGLVAASAVAHLGGVFRGRVVVRNGGLAARHLFRTERLAWDDVSSVRYRGWLGWVARGDGKQLIVPNAYGGRAVFAEVCRRKLGPATDGYAGEFRGPESCRPLPHRLAAR